MGGSTVHTLAPNKCTLLQTFKSSSPIVLLGDESGRWVRFGDEAKLQLSQTNLGSINLRFFCSVQFYYYR